MTILFFTRHFSYLRNFESAIEALAARGHRIHLCADKEESIGGAGMVERLAARHEGVTMGWTPARPGGIWPDLSRQLRLGIDYLRFLDSRYDGTPRLRGRARERAPGSIVRAAGLPGLRTAAGRRVLAWALRQFEDAIPRSALLERFMREVAPDVVLITPLVDLGSPQLDHFRSARALGLRTALCVGSWDHLSSKSLLRWSPDLITVWNDTQRREAIEMHGMPADRIVVTGAQCYDQWFGRAPSRTREELCAAIGLDPRRPYVLYACSSLFRQTVSEAEFVERWIRAVRSADDPVLRDAGLLIRPHPARLDEWRQTDLSEYPNLAFFGGHAVDRAAKDDYFDSMHYAAAVVGLNTSAFLEAGVVGRPVLAVLLPEVSRDNQEGTLHFRYLLEVGGGLLETARDLDEHVRQLSATLQDAAAGEARARRFTEGFIRPEGLDQAATPRFADAIERLAAAPRPQAAGGGTLAWLVRPLLLPWLAGAYLRVRTQPWRKQTRYRWNRFRRHFARNLLLSIRGFVTNRLRRMMGVGAPGARPATGAMLTPKRNKPRDSSKSFLFPGVLEVEEARETVTMLGRQDRPIIVGPWLTETGFELLYWIPFLAWAKAYGNLHEDQLWVVSRGGAGAWYDGFSHQYHDVLSFCSPDEFRRRNDERVRDQKGRFKHVEITEFDREIVRRVEQAHGLGRARVLHPSLMYNLFSLFWRQQAPITLVEAFCRFRALSKPPLGDLAPHLPAEYVAVKFYGNSALPDTPGNRAFVTRVLADLTRHSDVVLLNTGQKYDDHDDYAPVQRDRVHTVDHLMRPEQNLDVQTRIICGARAFVGTYGGFSYLAPFYGVDTLAFYSHPTGFRFDHLEVAKRVFSSLGTSFAAVDLRELEVLRLGLGRAGSALAEKVEA